MEKVTTVLLDSKSMKRREKDVSGSSSALVMELDVQRQNKSGRKVCHKCGKPNHFRRDCPERRLSRPSTPENSSAAIAMDEDIYVLVCFGMDDMVEAVGDGTCSDGACKSWVIDSSSTFHVCPRRDWFYSLCEVSNSTMTLWRMACFCLLPKLEMYSSGCGMVWFAL